jgi:hypothetical protein
MSACAFHARNAVPISTHRRLTQKASRTICSRVKGDSFRRPSETWPSRAFHFTASPSASGQVAARAGRCQFRSVQAYLQTPAAFRLYEPELPLRRGWIPPGDNMTSAGVLRDASPDSWGSGQASLSSHANPPVLLEDIGCTEQPLEKVARTTLLP